MKHLIALALAALLALSCAGFALAEAQTYDLFTVGGKATLTLTIDREPLYITLDETFTELGASHATVEMDGLAPCVISVAKSDIAEDQSLTDMGEEGLETLKARVSEQFENPEILTGKVGDITYIAIKTCGEASDVHSVFTIEKGYFVQLDQYRADFSELSEEDETFAREVLAGLNVRTAE